MEENKHFKRLVIGDIHGHWTNFKAIYDKEQPDEVIILGDYFDNFNGKDIEILSCFNDLRELQAKHKSEKSGDFIMLIGNHDYHYMYWHEQYSGFRRSYYLNAHKGLMDLFDAGLLKYIHVDNANRTIYSHAGVTNTWMSEWRISGLDEINSTQSKAFSFTYKGNGDIYGNTKYASPIWCRPNALDMDSYKDEQGLWTQVVGHTHSHEPMLFGEDGNVTIYVMDTMPKYYMVEYLDEESKLIKRETNEFKEVVWDKKD